MKQVVLGFGLLILSLLVLFQLSHYSYFRGDWSIETVIAVCSLVFFGLGLYFSRKYFMREKTVVQAPPPTEPDLDKVAELGITRREYEVLQQIALGLSNKEIGEKLFVSESTIKTHASNLLLKLDARSRTQAVLKAKTLQIIA